VFVHAALKQSSVTRPSHPAKVCDQCTDRLQAPACAGQVHSTAALTLDMRARYGTILSQSVRVKCRVTV
jgi:hypothetical protein